jgi:phytoene dehydrogenase-like protein
MLEPMNASDRRYDALVVGGGHNALTSAAYLAKAGYKVAVFERRHVIGGAVCTEDDIIPGYKVDVGSGVHIMIHLTPVIKDLDLEQHGLQYLEMDPIAWQPTPGEKVPGFGLYRDLERTVESIHAISPKDAMAYREFVKSWDVFADKLFAAFQKAPTVPNLITSFAGAKAPDAAMIQALFGSYGKFIREKFEHPAVRSGLAWLAAQSGPAPAEIGAGGFLMWHAVLHKHGAKRAVGGSGALTKALQKAIEHHGGDVFLEAPVAKIELENGHAKHVILEDGRVFSGKVVISGAHVQTTMLDLIGPEHLPPNLPTRVQNIRVGNGFGLIHRIATSALPDYGHPDATNGMQLLVPSIEYLETAFRDYDGGIPSRKPCALGMTFTKLDPSLAPAGKHLVYLWAQYYPFDRSDGRVWDKDAELEEGSKLEEILFRYAPNMRGTIEHRFTQTPLDLEKRIGLRRGNVMHVEMSFDQMFTLRPLPELSGYRTPIPGLYLCGASTHPGGGVFAASGRASAMLAMFDLEGGYPGKAKKWASSLFGR